MLVIQISLSKKIRSFVQSSQQQQKPSQSTLYEIQKKNV